MISIKFFEYGCPADSSLAHYGLYQPVLDRFVFTVDDLEIAQEIKLLMASRFGLYIFDLTQADNYQPNLIDNICCENWTVDNKKIIKITQSYREFSVLPVGKLVPVTEKSDWTLLPEQEWMHTIRHWTCFYLWMQRKFYPWFEIDEFIDDVCSTDMPGQYQTLSEFKTMIRTLLYFERDHDSVLDQINCKLESSIFLKKGYELWTRKLSM